MWESSVYKLNQPVGKDDDDNYVYKQVVIDVIRSAPSFAAPGKALISALKNTLAAAKVEADDSILDFGAGKLRNTIYLLEKGYRVCAVEFADQFKHSSPACENLERAKSEFADRFSTLVYPHEFVGSEQQFKLVLLINVINIMPIPSERRLVLKLLHERLSKDGRLLWYTQRGDAKYRRERMKDQYKIGDGFYVGRKAKYKTFYREYKANEIDVLLAQAGFHFDRSIEATWRNQSLLYRKVDPAPLAKVINPGAIERGLVIDDKIPDPETVEPKETTRSSKRTKGDPNPDKLKLDTLWGKALAMTAEGYKSVSDYETTIWGILKYLFANDLRNLQFVPSPLQSNGFRDILADNKSERGFFFALKNQYRLKCNHIRVECRNFRHSLQNNAFDKIGAELNRHMNFGMLAYRGGISKSVIERCRRLFLASEKVIIPLNDNDFNKLLHLRNVSQSDRSGDFDAFLFERLSEVTRPGKVFVSYSHKDRKYLDELQEQLHPLIRKGVVSLWDDTKLGAGERWNEIIQDTIATIEVAILLVSPSFQASDYIVNDELDPLLNPGPSRKVEIIPVLIRPTNLLPELEALQFVNHNYPLFGKRKDKKDNVWMQVTDKVRAALG
jgi:hypothetical protein